MRYREFGRTGLQVSELVFGGGFVGGILVHADDETKLKALRRAPNREGQSAAMKCVRINETWYKIGRQQGGDRP